MQILMNQVPATLSTITEISWPIFSILTCFRVNLGLNWNWLKFYFCSHSYFWAFTTILEPSQRNFHFSDYVGMFWQPLAALFFISNSVTLCRCQKAVGSKEISVRINWQKRTLRIFLDTGEQFTFWNRQVSLVIYLLWRTLVYKIDNGFNIWLMGTTIFGIIYL